MGAHPRSCCPSSSSEFSSFGKEGGRRRGEPSLPPPTALPLGAWLRDPLPLSFPSNLPTVVLSAGSDPIAPTITAFARTLTFTFSHPQPGVLCCGLFRAGLTCLGPLFAPGIIEPRVFPAQSLRARFPLHNQRESLPTNSPLCSPATPHPRVRPGGWGGGLPRPFPPIPSFLGTKILFMGFVPFKILDDNFFRRFAPKIKNLYISSGIVRASIRIYPEYVPYIFLLQI